MDNAAKNIILVFCDDETTCIYDTTGKLTQKMVELWCNMSGVKARDICMNVKQDQLQYYVIDGRVLIQEAEFNNLMDKLSK